MPARRVVTGRSQEPRRRFAEELRLLRAAKGDSLRQLEEVLGWTASTFGKMEGGQSLGSPEVVEALDQHYGTGSMLLTLWELAVADPSQFKEQYRRYMTLEAEAVGLWQYSVSTPPGLLQTAGYAREALAGGRPQGRGVGAADRGTHSGGRKVLEGSDAPPFRVDPRPRRCCVTRCATLSSGGGSWSSCWRRRSAPNITPPRAAVRRWTARPDEHRHDVPAADGRPYRGLCRKRRAG